MKRYFNLFLLLLFPFSQVFSQEFNWTFSGGGWTDDFVSDIAYDNDGNIYVGGYQSQFSPEEIHTHFVSKIHSSGAILYTKLLDEERKEYFGLGPAWSNSFGKINQGNSNFETMDDI